jgi:hypothetical protein
MRIDVDDDEHPFGSFGSFGSFGLFGDGLTEPQKLRVVGVVERKRGVLLQCAVGVADFVDPGDQFTKIVG